jgi:hypothetical protein
VWQREEAIGAAWTTPEATRYATAWADWAVAADTPAPAAASDAA